MSKTMNMFKVGESGLITNVGGEGRVRRRLFDMGVTPGATFKVEKMAPLGDPMQITIRNYELTLRKSEALVVTAEEVEK